MSHKATNWAIQQRGLGPAAKIVLWHLCDRYHPDNGCFPSQETLAFDCEMSRASVNRHLDALEAANLILREQAVDPDTRRQRPTRYHFPFEDEWPALLAAKQAASNGAGGESRVSNCDTGSVSQKAAEPCLKNRESRVSNCDTNPVREPVKEPSAPARASEPEGSPAPAAARRDEAYAGALAVADWVVGGARVLDGSYPRHAALWPDLRCGSWLPKAEWRARLAALPPPALARAASWVRWAEDLASGRPDMRAPIAPVAAMLRALTDEALDGRQAASAAARAGEALAWADAARAPPAGGDQSEEQETVDAAGEE